MNPIQLPKMIIISAIIHCSVLILLQTKAQTDSSSMRQVGIKGGVKNPQIFVIRKSNSSGREPVLSVPEERSNSGARPLSQVALPLTTSPANKNHNSEKVSVYTSTQKNEKGSNETSKKILMQTVSGKEVQAVATQGQMQGDNSRFSFDGSMFDVGIVVPDGVSEDQLNRMEEMFYSFRKRVAVQYINQVQLMIGNMEKRYPHTSFPWTAKAQQLRAKLIFDEEGNLQRIDDLKKSDVKILQEYFREVTNEIYKIPNPPRAILNSNNQFELVLGLNIIE